MDRLEGFRKRTDIGKIWIRPVREAQELSHQRLSKMNIEDIVWVGCVQRAVAEIGCTDADAIETWNQLPSPV